MPQGPIVDPIDQGKPHRPRCALSQHPSFDQGWEAQASVSPAVSPSGIRQ